MADNLRIVVRSVRSERLEAKNIAAFEQALIFGITFQTSADHSGTFTELMSSGRANILRDRNLLDELVGYEDFLTRFGFAQQYYIDLVMKALPGYVAAFAYDADLQLSQQLFDGDTESVALVSYDFDALSADPAFENAAEQLMFVHSGFVLWRQRDQRACRCHPAQACRCRDRGLRGARGDWPIGADQRTGPERPLSGKQALMASGMDDR
jgi:hypothetical protein